MGLCMAVLMIEPQPAHAESTTLKLETHKSAPYQIGNETRKLITDKTDEIVVMPTYMGLRGPSIRLISDDFRRAEKHEGSAEEIWRNTEFTDAPVKPLWRNSKSDLSFRDFNFALDNQVSLQDDSGVFYRSSFIAGSRGPNFLGLIDTGYSFRLNIADNLDNVATTNVIRGDSNSFTKNRVNLDTLYAALTHSFRSDLHVSMIGGYLEEMFAGAGGEILYRPYNSRFAFGAEGWYAHKRDGDSTLALNLGDYNTFTAHMNAWYALPFYDLTLHAKAGRYLAEDKGGTLSIEKTFSNGINFETYITATNENGIDLFGDTSKIAQGVRLSVPLGKYKYMPEGSSVRLSAEPLTRDSGQTLINPIPLYEATERFSMRHMEQYWNEVTP